MATFWGLEACDDQNAHCKPRGLGGHQESLGRCYSTPPEDTTLGIPAVGDFELVSGLYALKTQGTGFYLGLSN